MYQAISKVSFPIPSGIHINMMPILFGDDDSIPKELHGYIPIINLCNLTVGSKAYLSINETYLSCGQYQRRPGIHTDGISNGPWGGGWGGTKKDKGIYVASTDGRCRIWDCLTKEVNNHGSLKSEPNCKSTISESNTLYWMTDRTPHESLSSLNKHIRQWFRLVGDDIYAWWAQHSTPNPFGVFPNAKIELGSKF